uniref:Uncharacterized protein n=1 Tax=Cucumis melo TaxID=3656 RepID=A0A9I9EL01_CUCME
MGASKAPTIRSSITFLAEISIIDPMRLTRSPSLIVISLPKTTIPIFSFSRFKAISFVTVDKFYHFLSLNLLQSINSRNSISYR